MKRAQKFFTLGFGILEQNIFKENFFFHSFIRYDVFVSNSIFFRYSCTADNGVGNPVLEEILLTVLCKFFTYLMVLSNLNFTKKKQKGFIGDVQFKQLTLTIS